MDKKVLRDIPSVDEVLKDEGLQGEVRRYSREAVTQAVRYVLNELRTRIISGQGVDVTSELIRGLVKDYLRDIFSPSLKRMVNASGTILHTNLGRAILCEEAVEAMKLASTQPVNLEYDLERGVRGDRDSHVEALICKLTGAEAATVVNNNAAAVLLVLNTLAEGKEVIVSRGELIEIGGSFRIPEIILKSGCKLVEVGTTNRTHPEDYIKAIGPDTALLLKAHTSNYRIVGFTSSVDLKGLVAIGRQYNLPVVEDLGSGSLVDLSIFGLPKEPVVRERVEAGADVVTFSADKLLGGPQAGVIVGRKGFIEGIKKNPLKRALRVDKITIAGLEATLKLYLNLNTLPQRLPTLRFLTRSLVEIEGVADRAVRFLKNRLGGGYTIMVEDGESQIGSGSLPEDTIPTKVISITHRDLSPERIAERFLKGNPPILGRIHKEKFLLDMRMVMEPDEVVPCP